MLSEEAAKVLRDAFNASGMTQAEVAKRMRCDKRTIQNWLAGNSGPGMDELRAYFTALGVPADRYMSAFFHKGLYDDVTHINLKDEADIRDCACNLMRTRPLDEVQIINMIFLGNHGRYVRALLHLVCMYLHATLDQCSAICSQILTVAIINQKRGDDNCPGEIQPDIDLVKSALKAATVATGGRKSEYTL